MRRRILAIPAVADIDTFGTLVAHLSHYFSHVDPERIAILVDADLLPQAEQWLRSPTLPPAFGDRVAGRIEATRPAIKLRSWPRDLESLALNSDLLLDWDAGSTGVEPWTRLAARYRAGRTRYTIDWLSVRHGATWLAEAAKVLKVGRGFDAAEGQRMADLVRRLGRSERAYLIGTGPSARDALDRDLSDGLRIICNTVILDRELMDHVRPDVLTFADPIFHFGPSTYAQRFHEALVEEAERHDFAIVTTERYSPLLRALAPEVADRVIGLRQGIAAWPPNLDLIAHPAVRPYPNVLTMLMLPLATTLSRSIGFIGFDGRVEGESYFWRHGTTVQLEQELQDIRLVHPGFFELDYADYYETHVATLDRLLTQAEDLGVEARPISPSHMAALRRRSPPDLGAAAEVRGEKLLVSITPDWIGDFGHFGPLERRIHEVAEKAGHRHVALASTGLRPSAAWQLPTFSEGTFAPQNTPSGRRFEAELRAGLDALDPAPGSVAFIYTGDVWQLVAVLAVAAERPQLRFVVNLMRAQDWIERALEGPDPWLDSLVELLSAALAAAAVSNVSVTVDTDVLARDVEVLTGHSVGIWPMIAVADPPRDSNGRAAANGSVHIVSPVQAQGTRGFPELVALAEHVSGRLRRGDLRLTARRPVAGGGPTIAQMAAQFEQYGGQLIRDNLSDTEFAELVASADVALVPYQVRAYRTRTSGVAIDALMAGKPVITVRGTWAGNVVERYGAGVTYAEGDLQELDGALNRVVARLDKYRSRLAEIRSAVQAEFAPERLVEFVLAAPAGPADGTEQPPDTDGLRRHAERLRDLHLWQSQSDAAARMSAAIREDDLQRRIEGIRDDVDRLRRGLDRQKRRAAVQPSAPPGVVKARSARRLGRREAIRRALSGWLRLGLVAIGVLVVAAGVLAFAGLAVLAVLAIGAAVLVSALSSVVVAARLQRRG